MPNDTLRDLEQVLQRRDMDSFRKQLAKEQQHIRQEEFIRKEVERIREQNIHVGAVYDPTKDEIQVTFVVKGIDLTAFHKDRLLNVMVEMAAEKLATSIAENARDGVISVLDMDEIVRLVTDKVRKKL